MCKILYAICVTWMVGFVNSWDIAVGSGRQIEFYNSTGNLLETYASFTNVWAMSFEPVHNMILFIDKRIDSNSIYSIHLDEGYKPAKTAEELLRRDGEDIQGVTFDSLTNTVYWTDLTSRTIKKISLDKVNNSEATNILTLQDGIPAGIAVDSCRGYLYWSVFGGSNPKIQRSHLDGSNITDIVGKVYSVVNIALDQGTQRLYWADDKEGIDYAIESCKLDGSDHVVHDGTNMEPFAIAVNDNYIYLSDRSTQSIRKFSKNLTQNTQPEKIISFISQPHAAIAVNYDLVNQVKNIPECQELQDKLANKTVPKETFKNIARKIINKFLCLHGEQVQGEQMCKCNDGYEGIHCEKLICDNYCLHGTCSTKDGKPLCSCHNGFTGERCEKDACVNYCLNGGKCINQYPQVSCQCPTKYRGNRCEIPNTNETAENKTIECNCTETNRIAPVVVSPDATANLTDGVVLGSPDGFFVEANCAVEAWNFKDTTIMVLGSFCGILCISCAVLITKVLQLKKRPRIKRRIIVNKNVTPLTARPDQCEITIENCCNMNICETPCFEPRTINPNLFDRKPGKEEKKNLIDNMEHPDD